MGGTTNMRKRTKHPPSPNQFLDEKDWQSSTEKTTDTKSANISSRSVANKYEYWLTRIILLRFIGFIYAVAFLVAYHQNRALLGHNGLLPADKYLQGIKQHSLSDIKLMLNYAPTVFWFFDYSNGNIDWLLDTTALIGLCLSIFVVIRGSANILIMAFLWILYHSIVNVGQRWYSFGWESQLLESGFLAIFLCPLISIDRFPSKTKTPLIVIWGYRWLVFRIMIGAGLIKIRGDKCWRDLTCMNYHYETQPVPNPLSYFLHQSPGWWHKVETIGNHFIELVVPWLLLLPQRKCQIIGGSFQILFQVILILSGNLSFLNWLTILPSLACFDDASLSWLFSPNLQSDLRATSRRHRGWYIRQIMHFSLGVLLVFLSFPVVQNLLSSRQAMNTSFDPLRIVNTYGAFGSITKERTEVILQGTYDDPGPNAKWYEYEFKCKPGNVSRRPCLISPYHYRLDWLMWFAAFQNYQHNPWLLHLTAKLLVNDNNTLSLISHNPFEDKLPPKFIQAEHYRYSYTKIGSKAAKSGKWYNRRRLGVYMPPVNLDSLLPAMNQMGWKVPRITQ